ncbi:MAG: helix-turn-helix transcriptional regulator [Firmicutes bacterium]|nr:helix-turn-helix transcriptional regulator [Bacillota bacterium]
MGSKYICNDLMAEIVKKYGSLKDLSDHIGVSYDTLYSKFAGRSEWKVYEAVKVAKALGLNLTEFVEMIGG